MQKKNGFTVVELLSSIVLISLIAYVLLQIIFVLKDMYDVNGQKTELLNKQGIISNYVNEAFITHYIVSVSSCGENCLQFVYVDGKIEQLRVDTQNHIISFGEHKTQFQSNIRIGNMNVQTILATYAHPSKNDALVSIQIPVTSPLIKEQDFGFHFVFQYNRSMTRVNL